jgi:fucose 4-O-acetylase-like acetyltransferase
MKEVALTKEKKNFDFVDTIRCIAMIGIVFEHAVYNGSDIFQLFSTKHIIYIGLLQLSKFGTIAFFVLAGFLLGNKFFSYSSWEYFKRRLSTVFLPWLIWSIIFILALLAQKYVVLKDKFALGKLLWENVKLTYLYTNYWFIINFMFCIGLLLIFKRYLYQWWLGALLFFASLVYSVNVYFEWFKPSHTIAIFGFVFFLWLGAMLNNKWELVEAKIKKTPDLIFIVLFLASFILSVLDTLNLISYNSADPYNTLRISNVIYSLVTILLFFKIKNFKFIKYLKPRETTFGVYLIHYIILVILLPELLRPLKLPTMQEMTIGGLILYVLCRFVLVYGITMLLIWSINKSKYRWIIGR